ncbi:MAG: branched-chain amino acid ABC transporter permease [Candidatus Sericytochromatia bacterium]
MSYFYHLLIYFNIYLIVSLSLNLLITSGLFQIAHAAFYGLGAYITAIILTKLGWGFFPTFFFTTLLTGFFSLLVSLPAWRFKEDYFVMLSLAVQVSIIALMENWESLTNGVYGISSIPRFDILNYKLDSIENFLVFSSILSLVCLFIMYLLLHSPWGRILKAMRDDELATRGLGKNTRLIKLQTFFISCSMVSIAGLIYSTYTGYVDSTSFSIDESILMISMVIVGGVGTLRGSIVGSFILILIPEVLRFLHFSDSIAANLRLLIYGVLLLLICHFRPQGLAGVYRVK